MPQSWGGNGSFAVLKSLEIDCGSNTSYSINDGITGSLPSEWGSSERFQFLQTLSINGAALQVSIASSRHLEMSSHNLTAIALQHGCLLLNGVAC